METVRISVLIFAILEVSTRLKKKKKKIENYPFQITNRPAHTRMTTHMRLFSRDGIALLSERKDNCTLKSHPPPLPNHSPS